MRPGISVPNRWVVLEVVSTIHLEYHFILRPLKCIRVKYSRSIIYFWFAYKAS